MSWAKFKSEVKTRGLARTNRYRVVIPVPLSNSTDTELLSLFCESVPIPGVNISTAPQITFGERREMPYEKMYDPVSMTFYIDTQMVIKSAFDRWMNLVISPTRRTIQYYESYVKPVEIFVATVDEKEPYKITLYEAYPKNIGSIQMSSESRDIMKLPVTFQYKYWRAESISVEAARIPIPGLLSLNSQGILATPPVSQIFNTLLT